MRPLETDLSLDEDLEAYLSDARQRVERGAFPAGIITDPRIHEREKTRLFSKTWVFVAHETELPDPGDYVVRYISDDSFIVIRDENSETRVLLNSCRHHGNILCRAEAGNTSHFRCSYHGWTYNNRGDLVGVPALAESYGDTLDKSRWCLVPPPKVETYNGLIFACTDPEAPSLLDHLDDLRWYLDIMTRRSEAGLRVVGPPQRWIVDCNWKLGADNFVGDAYHTLMTHRSMVEVGLLPPDPKVASAPAHIVLPHGHGLGVLGIPPGMLLPDFQGYPEELVESLERTYPTQEHVEVARRTLFIHGNVFPNLSFLNVLVSKDHMSAPVPFLTLRLWHPVSAEKMEMWSWFLVEADAPDWFQELSYECYVRTFGISGVFEQDDTENWRNVTRGTKGPFASRQTLNYEMGLDLKPDATWLGPGAAYPTGYAEAAQRNFWSEWLRHVAGE